jgi:DNA primase
VVKIEFKAGGNELAKVIHYYGLDDGSDKIVCPFHDDVNPSMKLDFDEGTFFCFGCAAQGDALRFVMMAEKELDDLHACLKYFQILKSDEVKEITKRSFHHKKVDKPFERMVATDYYYNLRTTDWEKDDAEILDTREYMLKRGFTKKMLNKFGARYTYNDNYPIIFPILDNDEFKGWVCRTTNKRVEKRRKYLYNTGFVKSETLCGQHKSKVIVIVEGYMDMLKMRQLGLKNVVALLGWHASSGQIRKLKDDGVEVIISALDNDPCGIKGTKYISQFFKTVRFAYPAGVKDPGDLSMALFQKSFIKTKRRLKNHEFN